MGSSISFQCISKVKKSIQPAEEDAIFQGQSQTEKITPPWLQAETDTICHWHSNPPQGLLFDCDQTEVTRYLEAVDKIQQSLQANGGGQFGHDLNSKVVLRLKHEFLRVVQRQSILTMGTDALSSTSDWNSSASPGLDGYSPNNTQREKVISYLTDVVKILNSGKHLNYCTKIYKSVRKSYFHSMTKQLRFHEFCAPANKLRLDELEMKVERWIRVAKLCFLVIFDREKQICCKIFSGFGSEVGEECFLEIVRDSANNLLNFVEAVSNTTHPWERMGTILGLYDTFLHLLPHINSLLDSDSAANATVSRLEDHIRRMLSDFEKVILHELLPILDDRGAIHSLTVKVMDYIDLMVSHKKMLIGLIKSMPLLEFGDGVIPDKELGDLEGRSHLALHLILIIVFLQLNLKGKSEQYRQVPLRHLFMMNNVGYIIQKIERSQELIEIIGDDYMRKLNLNVKEAMTSYQVSTCDELLYCFRDEGLHVTGCFSSVVLKREVRKRLKSFDSQFKEVQECHSNWMVHDSRLRDELRVCVIDKLIPAYERFLYEFGSYVEVDMQNVKSLVEDLQVLLSKNLFSCNEVIV